MRLLRENKRRFQSDYLQRRGRQSSRVIGSRNPYLMAKREIIIKDRVPEGAWHLTVPSETGLQFTAAKAAAPTCYPPCVSFCLARWAEGGSGWMANLYNNPESDKTEHSASSSKWRWIECTEWSSSRRTMREDIEWWRRRRRDGGWWFYVAGDDVKCQRAISS